MGPQLLAAFYVQIASQCRFVRWSAQMLDTAISRGRQAEETFFAIQALLVAAANISKALGAQKNGFLESRKPLRDKLGIKVDSPFARFRMRDNFEHFDERLVRWHDQGGGMYIDLNISNPAAYGGFDKDKMFRLYDPATATLYFWGQEFDVKEIVSAANALLARVTQEQEQPRKAKSAVAGASSTPPDADKVE